MCPGHPLVFLSRQHLTDLVKAGKLLGPQRWWYVTINRGGGGYWGTICENCCEYFMFFKTLSNIFVILFVGNVAGESEAPAAAWIRRWNADNNGRDNAALAMGRGREAEERCVLGLAFLILI